MQTFELYGYNEDFRINETSNNKYYIIPGIQSNFNVHSILSYSTFGATIVVTNDGISQAIGCNRKGQISNSLPREILKHFTKIELRDNHGRPCSAISAVCGSDYTLYMISSGDKSSRRQLAYAHAEIKSEFPIILNIGNLNPISIYGGSHNCAVIDSEGSIIYIDHLHFMSPTKKKIEPVSLPDNEKAISIACLDSFTIILSSSGRVFKMPDYFNNSLIEYPELKGKDIICISGIFYHCFAVSKEGQVFVIGDDYINDGCLGLSKNYKSVSKFTQVLSLNKYKITEAFAGCYHSIFKTQEGKLIACGNNDYGHLLINKKISGTIVYEPIETWVSNASFCIAGFNTTIVFYNYIPPMIPNKKIDFEKETSMKSISTSKTKTSSISDSESETSDMLALKSQISLLKKQLDEEIKEKDKLKKLLFTKEKEFKEQLSDKEKEFKNQKENYEKEIKKLQDPFDNKNPAGKIDNKDAIEDNFFISSEEESNYETIGKVGEGNTYIVYKLIDKRTHIPLCKKVLKIERSAFKDAKNAVKEFEVLHALHHPSICSAIGINISEVIEEEDDEITTVAIFVEFIDYNLKDCLEKNIINNTLKTRIIIEIAQGLRYLHSKGMIYRDLKLSNIMLNSIFQAKMIDFGLVKINEYLFGEETMSSISITKSSFEDVFMSPEMTEDNYYDFKTDVYSFGILIYYLFVGELPKQSMKEKMMNIPIQLPKPSSSISKCCIQLISNCISKETENRPTFDDVLKFLRENKYMLASDVDPFIIFQRDKELELLKNT